MLRLRTTAGLSALALLTCIAGTSWLSSLTEHWRQPSAHVAMVGPVAARPRRTPKAPRWHGPVTLVQSRRGARPAAVDEPAARHAAAPVVLQPLATPADTSQSWSELRGHLDGRLLVRVRIDGAGRVEQASVIASSGDPILDRHALLSVRGWRFAVPPDQPAGVSGDLPMRFSSHDGRLGML